MIAWTGAPSDLTRVEREYGPHDGPLVARETRGSGNATVAYAYDDPRLLLTGITRGGEVVSYGYTASGEKGTEQSPSGLVSYRYDALDRLEYVDSPRGTTQVTWEPGGARLLDVAGPTLTECRRYDERGRLRFVASVSPADACETLSPLSRFDYGYDDRGNRLREEYLQTGQALEVTQYGYDLADRLVSVVSPSGAETRYGLGGDGSRLTETHAVTQGGAGAMDTYHYDTRGGLTSITDELGAPVATYTVDVAGRVLSEARADVSKSLTWDAGGRLVSAAVEKALPGGGTVTDTLAYRYDHAGRRIWKQGPQGETTYLWGDGELVDEVLPSGTRVRYERAEGMALAAGPEALLHDGLGSVVGRVAAVAPVYYRYDAWGRIQGQGPTAGEASLAYAGQHWDEDLGLSYAQQRWYEPKVGRFLSEDPVFGEIARPGSLLVFGYANGNPVAFVDPTGERSPNVLDQSQIDSIQFLIDRERKKSWLERSWIGTWELEAHLEGFKSAVAAALEDEPIHFVPGDASPHFRPELAMVPGSRSTAVGSDSTHDRVYVETWGNWMPEGNISWVDSAWRDVRACLADAMLPGRGGASACPDPRPGQGRTLIADSSEGGLPQPVPDEVAIPSSPPNARDLSRPTGPATWFMDNNVVSSLGSGIPQAVRFARANTGRLATTRGVVNEFLKQQGRTTADWDQLQIRYGIEVFEDAPEGATQALMTRLGITSPNRVTDISLLAAARGHGGGVVTADRVLGAAAAKTGTPLWHRLFEGTREQRTQAFQRFRRGIEQIEPVRAPTPPRPPPRMRLNVRGR